MADRVISGSTGRRPAPFRPEPPYLPTVPVVVRRASEDFGSQDFIVMPDRRITFREADVASRNLAKQLLAAGVGKGTRVGIHLPTGVDWAVVWLAITRIGALAMPFSTLFRPPELRTALRLGDVAVLISQARLFGKDHERFLEATCPGLESSQGPLRLRELPYLRSVWLLGDSTRGWGVPVALDKLDPGRVVDGFDEELLAAHEAQVSTADDLHVTFTSGSSASPKAVLHTHGAVIRKTAPVANAGLDATFPGRVLSLMPFFWVGGVQMVAGALQSGASILTLERIVAAEAIELGRREHATSLAGNPAVLRSLMGSPAAADLALPALRPQPRRPWDGAPPSRSGDPAAPLGMTETLGVWARVDGFDYLVVDPDTDQPLADGCVGEFLVRGYGLMRGFYKQEREDTFTAEGFYRTGDLGYLEGDNVYFHSRKSEMIKTKGANVAPAEVEAVLNAATGVRMSFVVGLAHEVHGEEVVAAVLPEAGVTVDPDSLLDLARRSLSSYKVPQRIEWLRESDLTFLPSGKPSKRAVAELLAKRASGPPTLTGP